MVSPSPWGKGELDKDTRLNIHRCQEALEFLDKVKKLLWDIEVSRTNTFGRTDELAVLADKILDNCRRRVISEIIRLQDLLEEKSGG